MVPWRFFCIAYNFSSFSLLVGDFSYKHSCHSVYLAWWHFIHIIDCSPFHCGSTTFIPSKWDLYSLTVSVFKLIAYNRLSNLPQICITQVGLGWMSFSQVYITALNYSNGVLINFKYLYSCICGFFACIISMYSSWFLPGFPFQFSE